MSNICIIDYAAKLYYRTRNSNALHITNIRLHTCQSSVSWCRKMFLWNILLQRRAATIKPSLEQLNCYCCIHKHSVHIECVRLPELQTASFVILEPILQQSIARCSSGTNRRHITIHAATMR